jgi:hypothetical protein
MPDQPSPDRPTPGPDHAPAREPLHELTLGRSRPPPGPEGVRPQPLPPSVDDGSDLEALAARCRGKAEAARWAAERQRRIRERLEVTDEGAPTDPMLRRWAESLEDAFYWGGAADPSGAPDIATLDEVGGCFEAVAEGLLLVRDARQRPDGLERALPLLAEAQSALRRSLRRVTAPDDPDQIAAYEVVREMAARHRIFVKRFLRADDLADPAGWPRLLARIEGLEGCRPKSKRGIDRDPATRSSPAAPETSRATTAEVRDVAQRLAGRSIVLIGGLRRPEAQRSLESALGLRELVWIETKEHQSIAAFEPAIARPDVALVLLAIRWSSHAFGEVNRHCERHGKPLVRLPGGYNPAQVAAQILDQCSERLGPG